MNSVSVITITVLIVLVIALARKLEVSILPGALIIMNLFLLVYHSYVLNSLPSAAQEGISAIYLCIAMDFLWLLISFLGFLWIDDIIATKYNKKSYDNSLSWFWNKF